MMAILNYWSVSKNLKKLSCNASHIDSTTAYNLELIHIGLHEKQYDNYTKNCNINTCCIIWKLQRFKPQRGGCTLTAIVCNLYLYSHPSHFSLSVSHQSFMITLKIELTSSWCRFSDWVNTIKTKLRGRITGCTVVFITGICTSDLGEGQQWKIEYNQIIIAVSVPILLKVCWYIFHFLRRYYYVDWWLNIMNIWLKKYSILTSQHHLSAVSSLWIFHKYLLDFGEILFFLSIDFSVYHKHSLIDKYSILNQSHSCNSFNTYNRSARNLNKCVVQVKIRGKAAGKEKAFSGTPQERHSTPLIAKADHGHPPARTYRSKSSNSRKTTTWPFRIPSQACEPPGLETDVKSLLVTFRTGEECTHCLP